jgi:hypothetical protein
VQAFSARSSPSNVTRTLTGITEQSDIQTFKTRLSHEIFQGALLLCIDLPSPNGKPLLALCFSQAPLIHILLIILDVGKAKRNLVDIVSWPASRNKHWPPFG